MKTIRTALMSLVAVLLFVTPPAQAKARKHPKKGKAVKSQHRKAEAGSQELIRMGLSSLDARDYVGAIAAFKQATRLDKNDSGAFFLLGYAHYQKGFQGGAPSSASRQDAVETIAAYTTALALDPRLSKVSAPYKLYHSMALSYEALESNDKAVECYRKAFEAAPHNPMLPLYAARLRLRMGETAKAASNLALSFRTASAQDKQAAIVKILKTDPNFSTMMAEPSLKKIAAQYDAGVDLAASAKTAPDADLRDSVRSAPDARRQIIEAPQQDPAVMKLLTAADDEYNFRRFRDAIDAYNATLRENQRTGTLSVTQLSMVYERMGTAYNKLGNSAAAIRALQYSLQQMPFNASANYQLALAYSVAGKFTQSLRALSEALKNAPSEGERRKLMLLAKTDSELDPLRDLPGFHGMMSEYSERLQASR